MSDKPKKPLPVFNTDAEAEHFVAEADLTQYDLTGGRMVHFEFEKKTEQVNLRLPANQLIAVKEAAEKRGIPYTRLMRQFIEQGMRTL